MSRFAHNLEFKRSNSKLNRRAFRDVLSWDSAGGAASSYGGGGKYRQDGGFGRSYDTFAHPREMDSASLGKAATTGAREGITSPTFWNTLVKRAKELENVLEPRDVALLLNALSRIRHDYRYHDKNYDKNAEKEERSSSGNETSAQTSGQKSKDATRDGTDGGYTDMKIFLPLILSKLAYFNSTHFAMVLSAFGKARVGLTQTEKRVLLQELRARVHEFQGSTEVSMLINALSKLQLNDTEFLQRFSVHIQNRMQLDPFHIRDLSVIAAAFVKTPVMDVQLFTKIAQQSRLTMGEATPLELARLLYSFAKVGSHSQSGTSNFNGSLSGPVLGPILSSCLYHAGDKLLFHTPKELCNAAFAFGQVLEVVQEQAVSEALRTQLFGKIRKYAVSAIHLFDEQDLISMLVTFSRWQIPFAENDLREFSGRAIELFPRLNAIGASSGNSQSGNGSGNGSGHGASSQESQKNSLESRNEINPAAAEEQMKILFSVSLLLLRNCEYYVRMGGKLQSENKGGKCAPLSREVLALGNLLLNTSERYIASSGFSSSNISLENPAKGGDEDKADAPESKTESKTKHTYFTQLYRIVESLLTFGIFNPEFEAAYGKIYVSPNGQVQFLPNEGEFSDRGDGMRGQDRNQDRNQDKYRDFSSKVKLKKFMGLVERQIIRQLAEPAQRKTLDAVTKARFFEKFKQAGYDTEDDIMLILQD